MVLRLLFFFLQVHDRMTECVYPKKLMSFKNDAVPEPFIQIPVMEVCKEIWFDEVSPFFTSYIRVFMLITAVVGT